MNKYINYVCVSVLVLARIVNINDNPTKQIATFNFFNSKLTWNTWMIETLKMLCCTEIPRKLQFILLKHILLFISTIYDKNI